MSDTVSSAKETLTEKLADLLGFADGAQDVMEHLLSIESSEVRSVLPSFFVFYATMASASLSHLDINCFRICMRICLSF